MPGSISIEGLTAIVAGGRKGIARAIPARALGDVEDIGYAALFFASPQSKFITAQTLVIDGGQVVPETEAAIL